MLLVCDLLLLFGVHMNIEISFFFVFVLQVKVEQGVQMLKIFKEHVSKTSILDDFAFYETRQKAMQEKNSKLQQIHKQACLFSLAF